MAIEREIIQFIRRQGLDMSEKTVLYVEEGRVGLLTLNRPNALNAMDTTMLAELKETLHQVKDSSIDVLIVTGSGKGFSAGGDLKSMLSNTDNSGFEDIMSNISEIITTLYTLPKLVISAVNGPAAGLGFSLALAADEVIASEKAVLAMNFIDISLIPDGAGHFFLKQRLNPVEAKQLIWQGIKMSAQDAKEKGLVDAIGENALDAAKQQAEVWLAKPTKAMIQTKLLYASLMKDELTEVLAAEKQGQLQMRQTADHQEGVQAFLEKRKPVFKGE
ncbi:enoyl-CoA hydratase [Bacillus tianshenii]|nr:enoyl-CoA hydratase [Bacillus tianshenii]